MANKTDEPKMQSTKKLTDKKLIPRVGRQLKTCVNTNVKNANATKNRNIEWPGEQR